MIGAKIPGRVERMLVEEGSEGQEGASPRRPRAQRPGRPCSHRARRWCSRTEAEVAEAKVDLREKERKAEPDQAAPEPERTVSVEECEKANAAREMATPASRRWRRRSSSRRRNVQETEETIRNMHIYAPFDGTVVEKQGEVGEIITPVGHELVDRPVGGRDARQPRARWTSRPTSPRTCSRGSRWASPPRSPSAPCPSKHYRGRLRQIIPMGDRTRGTVKVKVEILDPDEHLFPELVATVHFLPDKAARTTRRRASRTSSSPRRPSSRRTATTTSGWSTADRRVRKRQVEVASTNDDLARVESGLKAGEIGGPEPAEDPRDGETVKVAE